MIGERIKLARLMARMSQQQLADCVGVSKMAVSKYESGQMMPGVEVIQKLGDVLGVRLEFLLRRPPQLDIKPTYRKHARLGIRDEEAVIAEIREWLERYLAAESLFPPDEVRGFALPAGFPFMVKHLQDAETAAESLRQAWQLGEAAPIENLTELLEEQGIKVGLVHGGDDFDACTFWVNDSIPVIAVKQSTPGDRERFNLAHELGHIVLEVAPEMDEEKVAHRFAGAFLAPRRAAYRELGNVRHSLDWLELRMLKQKYGLSMAAWLYRARDLGILSEADSHSQWLKFSARGWRKEEPEKLPPESPGRMTRLVHRLLAEDVISRARARELLGERFELFVEREPNEIAVRG